MGTLLGRAGRDKSGRFEAKAQTRRVTLLEFWPDYGAGPLWTETGQPADLAALGLDPALVGEASAWNSEYAEDKVPIEGHGDEAWLTKGRDLLMRLRAGLGPDYEVVVTEPWWGEEPR